MENTWKSRSRRKKRERKVNWESRAKYFLQDVRSLTWVLQAPERFEFLCGTEFYDAKQIAQTSLCWAFQKIVSADDFEVCWNFIFLVILIRHFTVFEYVRLDNSCTNNTDYKITFKNKRKYIWTEACGMQKISWALERHCHRQEFVHLPRYVWELKLRISF